MSYFLGIDLGTSYFKAGLFSEDGRLQGLGRRYVKKVTKNNITCELPVDLFRETLRSCIHEAMQAANTTPDKICSISYSSQANSFVLLDGRLQPLTPLILWPDKRAEGIEIPTGLLDSKTEFQEKTGLGIDPGFQLAIAKIRWFQKMQPQLWKNVRSIMSISDYFAFILTGQKVSDYSTAAMTGLLDVAKCQWWDELLQSLNIDPDYLSVPDRTGTFAGFLTDEGARHLGLKQGTPFVSGGLDHHVAAIGAGVLSFKNSSESTGTVLACVNYRKDYLPKNRVCIGPGLNNGHYFQMAFDENGAASLEWYKNKYASGFSISELLEMAAHVEVGCDGLVAMPCAHTFPGMSGFENRKESHQHGHYIRAILESTSLSLVRLFNLLRETEESNGIISTGGGAKSRLWVQIKANVLDKSFFIPECSETACLGAAMLSTAGTGESKHLHETVRNWVNYKETIRPDPLGVKQYKAWNRTGSR